MSKEIRIAPGITKIRKDLKVVVTLERPYKGSPTDETSEHEGGHTVILVAKNR